MKNCILWTFALWLGGTAAGPLKAEAAARAGDRTGDVVVLKDVMVPMRDGVKLATDLYVPAENGRPAEARFPAVLLRTPYNKAAWGTELVRFFAQQGYLSATQDCRGRFASEGTFFPFLDDPKDGHDTIVWLAEHPLCNGKVGMHGPSYMAWTQKPTPMKLGQIYRLAFPLEPTANRFKAGHRIRVDICSSNFPNFDINPNTGDPNDRRPRIAANTVYHDAGHASYIELPVDGPEDKP